MYEAPSKCGKQYLLGEAKPGGFQTGGVPTFSGKVQIVSRTLSGLFLVDAVNRLRKSDRENPRTSPRTNRENPEKSPKQGQRRTNKSRSGNPPV